MHTKGCAVPSAHCFHGCQPMGWDGIGRDDKRKIVETKNNVKEGKTKKKQNVRQSVDRHKNAKNLQSVWFEFKLIRKKPHPKLNIMNVCVRFLRSGRSGRYILFSFLFQMITHNVRVCVTHSHRIENGEMAPVQSYILVELEIKSNKEVVFLSFSIRKNFLCFYLSMWVPQKVRAHIPTPTQSDRYVYAQTHSQTVKYQTNGPTNSYANQIRSVKLLGSCRRRRITLNEILCRYVPNAEKKDKTFLIKLVNG